MPKPVSDQVVVVAGASTGLAGLRRRQRVPGPARLPGGTAAGTGRAS